MMTNLSVTCFRRALFAARLCAAAWILVTLTTYAPGQEPAAKPAKPAAKARSADKPTSALDDALLKDLDNELLEGVQDLPARSPAKKQPRSKKEPDVTRPADGAEPGQPEQPSEQPADGESRGDDSATEDDSLGEDVGQGPEDPLMRIGRQMRTAERLMDEPQAAGRTQKLQGQIVDELAELIKQLEKQCQGGGGSSKPSASSKAGDASSREQVNQPKPGSGNPAGQPSPRPARDSTERLGKNETRQADMDKMRELMKDIWGQLPAHAREQMLQSSPERFLPKYELLIEKYYQRLAEEQKPRP